MVGLLLAALSLEDLAPSTIVPYVPISFHLAQHLRPGATQKSEADPELPPGYAQRHVPNPCPLPFWGKTGRGGAQAGPCEAAWSPTPPAASPSPAGGPRTARSPGPFHTTPGAGPAPGAAAPGPPRPIPARPRAPSRPAAAAAPHPAASAPGTAPWPWWRAQ